MERISWKVWIGILLVSLSGFFYLLHYAIFRDTHHIFVFMLHDIAFVPLEVLFVTLIIERLLREREKQGMLKKLNMLIGAFYSEVGTDLIRYLSVFVPDTSEFNKKLLISTQWSDDEFSSAMKYLRSSEHKVDSRKGDLRHVREYLEAKRTFLLTLLENPNMLEHESFTNLLWAVFHLTEELGARENIEDLPSSDYEHLSGDMKRAHSQLVVEWLAYMKHLKKDYPYLYSLSVRTNPFNLKASPVVS